MLDYPMKVVYRKKIRIVAACVTILTAGLMLRMGLLMLFRADYYTEKATQLHQRERYIKAKRGVIYDRNGVVLADNKTVCTISVIHNQITDPELVIRTLSQMLSLSEEAVRRKVEKVTAREIIRTNVEKEIGDALRRLHLGGVKVDEDYRRYYPYGETASKVLGFTGGDNQGIIGLEVKYEELLRGTDGSILTMTNAAGIELDAAREERIDPIPGNDLVLSLDINIQRYAQQAAEKVREEKKAKQVSLIVMRPDNGEILAMVNVPEFNLNEPFVLPEGTVVADEAQRQEALNAMWRNACISDTYEPGSAFKIITMAAALEEGVVTLADNFHCPGYRVVDDRRIRCHKVVGHGAETFLQGAMNSCNPVFIDVGLRLGVERYYHYFETFGLAQRTGVDLPGEAGTIMHRPENMKNVELATVSFGQSFQITPIRMLATVASLINGGKPVTPHLGVKMSGQDGNEINLFTSGKEKHIISEDTVQKLRYILEQVVEAGTGSKAYLAGFHVGGKTATSEKLPRGSGRYIASFVGFAPADDPKVVALVAIDEPEGIYYGGTIAAPVIADVFENILPYLGIAEDEAQKNGQ